MLGLFQVVPALSQDLTDIAGLIRESRLSEARSLLRSVSDDTDPEAVLFLTAMLAASGDSATALYQNLFDEHPDGRFGDDALLRLGQARYAQGLYRSAINTCRQLVKAYPSSPLKQTCFYWIGLSFQAVQEPDSATAYLRLAADTYPDSDLSTLAAGDLRRINDRSTSAGTVETQTPSVRYAVQIGAFADQTNALLRKSYFEQKGYEVNLRTKIRSGNTLYLVWVGSFDNREDAYRSGEQIKRKYGVSYTLVTE